MQYSFSKFFIMQFAVVVQLLSHQRKGDTKSLETVLWMTIWGCGSPAHCCQPAVAGGIIYADLSCERSTHLALKALFTQSSPVCEPHTGGGDTAPAFSGKHVYSHFTWEVVFPLSCGGFLLLPLLQTLLLQVAGHVPLLLPFPAACCEVFPCPPFGIQGASPSLLHVFLLLLLLLIIHFFFFPPWEGSVC
jgi:hypothetical protein